jgi:hypothetical protein
MNIYVGGALNGLKLIPGQNTYNELVPERYPNSSKIYDSIYVKFINFSQGIIQPDEIFSNQSEIRFALLLSSDGLLPEVLQKKLSLLTLESMDEAIRKKYTLETLKICAPPSGRKLDMAKKHMIYTEIQYLRSQGQKLEHAITQVASNYRTSDDSIRGHYRAIQVKLKRLKK